MSTLPKHIAIVMDGNGRWAKKKLLPRIAGHRAGVEAVRHVITACAEKNIEVVSLFAFSSENWQRPPQEVNFLMDLFFKALEKEAEKLHQQHIQLRVIGDRSRFDEKLQQQIQYVEQLTSANTGLKLVIAANYGGRWDIVEAFQKIMRKQGMMPTHEITFDMIAEQMALADLPEPDLFIRTSGEQRISNFMLWQLAYTELYFTDVLWPDFNQAELEKALDFFQKRERRFGGISD